MVFQVFGFDHLPNESTLANFISMLYVIMYKAAFIRDFKSKHNSSQIRFSFSPPSFSTHFECHIHQKKVLIGNDNLVMVNLAQIGKC